LTLASAREFFNDLLGEHLGEPELLGPDPGKPKRIALLTAADFKASDSPKGVLVQLSSNRFLYMSIASEEQHET
jgi:hypothetical protein